MPNAAVHAHDRKLPYRHRPALHGVHLDITEGAVVCLLSSNGYGKPLSLDTLFIELNRQP
jgi:ABC-type branched-subunit amino acid transport system ATPase component